MNKYIAEQIRIRNQWADGLITTAERDKLINDSVRRQRASASRKARHEALTSLGLVRVKGALGGTYYE